MSCFNGAMTFQPWKEKSFSKSATKPRPLQWGHDFSAMERMAAMNGIQAKKELASMGP